jgi:hypothetical protein
MAVTSSTFPNCIPKHYLKKKRAGCQWLMPVILATQETEIRRTEVQSQPRQIVLKKNPSQKRAGRVALVQTPVPKKKSNTKWFLDHLAAICKTKVKLDHYLASCI